MTDKTKWFVGITAACLLRLLFFQFGVLHPERFFAPDSVTYLNPGLHLQEAYCDPSSPFFAQGLERPPGYPLLIAGVAAFHRPPAPAAIIFAQILVSIGSVFLLYGLTKSITSDPEAARWAALLFALDPLAIVESNYILSETLFTFVLLAAVLSWWIGIRGQSLPKIVLAGLLFGAAALTRPAALYLVLVFVPVAVFSRKYIGFRKNLVAVTIPFSIVVLLWIGHNHQLTREFVFSTIEGKNFLDYNAAHVLAGEKKIPIEEARSRLHTLLLTQTTSEMNPAEISRVQKRLGIHILLQYPFRTAKDMMIGIAKTAFGPGRAALLKFLKGTDAGPLSRWEQVLIVWQILTLAILYGGVVLGVQALARQKQHAEMALLLLLILYFYVLTASPEAYSRFRAPVLPYLCLLCGHGIRHVLAGRQRKARTNGVRIENAPPPTNGGGFVVK
jgi:4-amino-4-deoxy-L-arabinose transferase-like glycosyltransferase